MMYSRVRTVLRGFKIIIIIIIIIIIFITTITFQGIQESLKPQNSLALPGHKSNIFKMGKNWGITAVSLSLPPKSGNFWKSGWKSRLLGSELLTIPNYVILNK